jgi:hypothetical protein
MFLFKAIVNFRDKRLEYFVCHLKKKEASCKIYYCCITYIYAASRHWKMKDFYKEKEVNIWINHLVSLFFSCLLGHPAILRIASKFLNLFSLKNILPYISDVVNYYRLGTSFRYLCEVFTFKLWPSKICWTTILRAWAGQRC